MAYHYEKNGQDNDLVIDGFETGIASSPHKGMANLQAVEISTELGEVSATYNRTKQSQTPITNGTLTASAGVGTSFLATSASLAVGQWINVSASTINGTPTSVSAQVLVVAGAAGGGSGSSNNEAGGGGAGGGVTPNSAVTLAVGSYAIVVGAGGAAAASGSNSSFGGSTVTAVGGGKGGDSATAGTNGGSGGGGGGINTSNTALAGGTGTASQGNAGGSGGATNAGGTQGGSGGGGGGAGAVGSNGAAGAQPAGAAGGAGTSSSISGSAVTYGSGGGGGAGAGSTQGSAASGGTGGTSAGNGGDVDPVTKLGAVGTAGTANRGGGGGGGGSGVNGGSAGGAGGSGVVIISVPTGYINATGGSLVTTGGRDVWTFDASGTFTITSFNAVTPLNTLNSGNWYVSSQDGSGNITLSMNYDPSAASINIHGTTGTATFSTSPNMGAAIAYASEPYYDGSTNQSRYFVLDSQGLVWVYDTKKEGTTGLTWFLPDYSTAYYSGVAPSGIAVFNGTLLVFAGNAIYFKHTAELADQTTNTTNYIQCQTPGYASDPTKASNHPAFVGHQGRVYYGDGSFVGALFPDTSIQSGNPNIQVYCKYTASTTMGTISPVITGSRPFQTDSSSTTLRVPVIFVAAEGGVIPTAITADTVYWVALTGFATSTFSAYAAQTGGAALDIQTGATGNQYITTFHPHGTGGLSLVTASNERVNLPPFEQVTSFAELGNSLLIGCKGNVVYPWNQVDVTPGGLIFLPEDNVVNILTVNNIAYLFAGTRGNIYITDGSIASLAIKVPDYCAGVPGSPATYLNPTFTWGGAAYIRGSIYFSVFDQTSAKAGNCGGIWSFVPTQNFYIGQDIGMALRLKAQNSYASYNGGAFLVIPRLTQTASQSLYWAAWESSTTSPTYGIDYSNGGTSASFPAVIETDYIKTGTFFDTKTDMQIEVKLTAPLDVGATIAISQRTTPTGAWTSVGTIATTSTTIDPASLLAAYLVANYQRSQWLQLQLTLTPLTSSAASNSFVRLREIRIR